MLLEEITDKKVLVRLDYNVPIEDGIIVNDFRIRQTYNTLNSLLDKNNKLIIGKKNNNNEFLNSRKKI